MARGAASCNAVDVDRDGPRCFVAVLGFPRGALTDGLLEDPCADAHDELHLLGDADELGGLDEPALGMVPAHECLGADDATGVELHLRLPVQHELTLVERTVEITFELQPPGRPLGMVVVEHLDACSATRLGLIHRGVGVAQQDIGAVVATDRQRDAHAHREEHRLIADAQRVLKILEESFGHEHGIVGTGDVLEQHDELVAAETADGVVGAEHRCEPFGEPDEHVVAGRVTEAVVDDLEVVDVEEHHRERRVVRTRMADRVVPGATSGTAHSPTRQPHLAAKRPWA